jgi:hypothetical protein
LLGADGGESNGENGQNGKGEAVRVGHRMRDSPEQPEYSSTVADGQGLTARNRSWVLSGPWFDPVLPHSQRIEFKIFLCAAGRGALPYVHKTYNSRQRHRTPGLHLFRQKENHVH